MYKNFWENKSKRYPKPFEDESLKRFNFALSKMTSAGISFDGKNVLDIASGTGVYGLNLALMSKSVLCIDFSKGMIDISKREAEKKKLKNVSWEICSFEKYSVLAKEKSFDIAIAAMTPAIKTEADILRMENLTKERCVFIGWAGKRKNKIAEEVLEAHKISRRIPRGYFEVKDALENLGRNFYCEEIEEIWPHKMNAIEAFEDMRDTVALESITPNEDLIKKILKKYQSEQGQIELITEARKGIIIWKV